MSGQSIMDRVTAAKHSIAGQGLAKSVCKATTEEVMGPKKKHLDYLILCTNEPNVSIPQMADLLIERTQYLNWVVVFKSLITIHNLMNYGNERFTQYLASNNCSFNLGSFLDKGGVQGYDMSTFIRRYAKYLNEKAVSYRAMAYDFCKVKRGKDDGLLRTMNTDKLLKALPVLQQQIDVLLEFDCTPNDLTNGVINASFMLMFKDLIRLFACYNDGIINLLEKYFDMNKKQCKEALDIYKKFLVRMDKVSEFLKVAENVGIDKGDIPDLAKGNNNSFGERISTAIGIAQKIAPASLLDALEQHLQSLDSKKGITITPTTKPAGFTSAINTMQSNSNNMDISEEEKKKILDEENKTLQQLKEQKLKETKQSPVSTPQSQTVAASSNPFATSTQTPPAPVQSKPSDDLLNLTGNPFVESVQSIMNAQPTMNTMHAPNPFGAPVWGAQQTSFFPTQPMYPYGYTPQQQQQSRAGFTSDADFDKVFNNTSGAKVAVLDVSIDLTPAQHQPKSSTVPSAPTEKESGFDFLYPFSGGTKDTTKSFPPNDFATWDPIEGVDNVFGDLVVGSAPAQGFGDLHLPSSPAFDVFGEVLQPISQSGKPAEQKKAKPITDDLDSSLVQLAGSLSVKEAKNKQYEWQPKGEQKKTGGEKWTAQPMASSTWSMGYPQQPVAGGMMSAPMQVPQPMVRVNQPMGMPAMGMAPMGVMGMGMAQPAMYGAIRPGMPPMGMAQPRPPHPQPNDPFGAL